MASKRILVLYNDQGHPMAVAELNLEVTESYMAAKVDLFDQVIDAFGWFVREMANTPERKKGKR